MDWTQVKMEYITTDTSYRQLAKKYNTAVGTIARHAKADDWVLAKQQYWNGVDTQVVQQVQDRTIEAHVDAAQRIVAISDKLLDKLEQAVDQLDRYMVVNRTREKTTTHEKSENGNKMVVERVTEMEDKRWVLGDIDRDGIKKLASALRDIKEIKGIQTLDDAEEENSGVIVIGERGCENGE